MDIPSGNDKQLALEAMAQSKWLEFSQSKCLIVCSYGGLPEGSTHFVLSFKRMCNMYALDQPIGEAASGHGSPWNSCWYRHSLEITRAEHVEITMRNVNAGKPTISHPPVITIDRFVFHYQSWMMPTTLVQPHDACSRCSTQTQFLHKHQSLAMMDDGWTPENVRFLRFFEMICFSDWNPLKFSTFESQGGKIIFGDLFSIVFASCLDSWFMLGELQGCAFIPIIIIFFLAMLYLFFEQFK